MSHYSRREFLRSGLAAGALAVTGSLPLLAERQEATDWVKLGKSGVKVTRLAFGTVGIGGRRF
jgi:1-deoxyxylulose-5-phosphate synthase